MLGCQKNMQSEQKKTLFASFSGNFVVAETDHHHRQTVRQICRNGWMDPLIKARNAIKAHEHTAERACSDADDFVVSSGHLQ